MFFVCLSFPAFSFFFCLGRLSSPGINERVHIALWPSHINACRLINPITQPGPPATLTFKITKVAASLAVNWLQLNYCSGNLQVHARFWRVTFTPHFFSPLTVICDQISLSPQRSAVMFKAFFLKNMGDHT